MARELKDLIREIALEAPQLGFDGARVLWDGDEPVYEVVYGPYILRWGNGELRVEVPVDGLSPMDFEKSVVIWQDGEWAEPGPWQDHLPSVVEALSKKIEERRLALEEAQKARRKALYERAARQVEKFIQAGGRESNGNRIRAFREHRGLSREELAEKAGVSVHDIAAWENGEAVPDLSSLILLARALEFPVEAFLAEKDETSFRFRGICKSIEL